MSSLKKGQVLYITQIYSTLFLLIPLIFFIVLVKIKTSQVLSFKDVNKQVSDLFLFGEKYMITTNFDEDNIERLLFGEKRKGVYFICVQNLEFKSKDFFTATGVWYKTSMDCYYKVYK